MSKLPDPQHGLEADTGQSPGVIANPWHALSRWTAARIALGRTGVSMPTAATLSFTADHATARDAIHAPFDTDGLTRSLASLGFGTMEVHSRAATRAEYLRRPDLGRSLDDSSREALCLSGPAPPNRLTIIVADGLSSLAATRNAVPLLEVLLPGLEAWEVDTVVLATQARVALADDVGALRGAEATLILIGERPGLKSPDSLGAYLTYRPRLGRNDAERNCVSNIRAGGLTHADAAARLLRLLARSRILGASGVQLKDDDPTTLSAASTSPALPETTSARPDGRAEVTPPSALELKPR